MATDGIKMPPAPKAKTGGFAFGDMSDSEEGEEEEEEEIQQQPKKVRNFGFDIDSDEDQSNMMMPPPSKKGYGPLGLDTKKFMEKGNLEINLNDGNDQFMMKSQKLPGLKEYDFNTIQPSREPLGEDDDNKIEQKFRNENTMAKSNLRQKDKTFNFGLAAGFSDSGGSEPEEQ